MSVLSEFEIPTTAGQLKGWHNLVGNTPPDWVDSVLVLVVKLGDFIVRFPDGKQRICTWRELVEIRGMSPQLADAIAFFFVAVPLAACLWILIENDWR